MWQRSEGHIHGYCCFGTVVAKCPLLPYVGTYSKSENLRVIKLPLEKIEIFAYKNFRCPTCLQKFFYNELFCHFALSPDAAPVLSTRRREAPRYIGKNRIWRSCLKGADVFKAIMYTNSLASPAWSGAGWRDLYTKRSGWQVLEIPRMGSPSLMWK